MAISELLPKQNVRGFASKQAARYASGTLWPHGEWSLGWAKERPDGGQWHEDPYVGLGVDDVAMAQRAAEGRRTLNLSDVPNSETRQRRGGRGITGYGQQMIKAAGHLLQERWPSHRKTLGTVTLPEMSHEARREVVEAWPQLTNELLKWLTRKLEQRGVPPVVCSVTEVQPKRLQASGKGYLHWHLLWLNVPAKRGRWSVCPVELRAWVDSALIRHCPSYTGGHVNVNTKRVEGVVAAYMAKYMSKGKQMIAEACEDWGEGNTPRTWWNMTKPCREMVKAATHRGRDAGRVLETFLYFALDTDCDEVYAFLRPIVRDLGKWEVIIGWRGRFSPGVDKDARGMLGFPDIREPRG